MEDADRLAVYSATTGAVLLLVAAYAFLIRETRGAPKRRRVPAMAAMAWRGVGRGLPSRHSVAVAAAGLGGFLAGGLLCAAACLVLLWWYDSTLPEEENVVAGAAGAMLLMMVAGLGLAFSFAAGLACGVGAALWVSARLARRE